jgi:cyanophycinase
LALWPGALVDTHFDRSGRVHRVMAALAQNPGVLGVGLDEDTAVEVHPEGTLRVVGRGVAFLFDARGARSNVADESATAPIALTGLAVHVLADGYGFDLDTRRVLDPVPPDEHAPDAHTGDDPERDGPEPGDDAQTPEAAVPNPATA